MESIVICIAKSNDYNFFAGLQNGKILEFRLTNFEQVQNANSSGNINLKDI